MKIDAHQHFWKYDPEKLPWIGDRLRVLKKDYLPQDLKPLLDQHGISGCVVVQASQTELETHFLLDLAAENPFIKGVVGWVNLEAKDLEIKLDSYLPFHRLKGFRHILQDEDDPNYILRPDFLNGIKTLGKRGYSYDILIFPQQMPGVIKALEMLPEMPLVLDHLAKPLIKEKKMQPWKDYIKTIADFPHVYCKLSGMVTENNWKEWKREDFYPYLEAAIEAFGEDRIMFGSDWPVCLLAASYSKVLGVVEGFYATHAMEGFDKLMGENAERFYRLHA
jgi:L-fuconolactonase